MKNNILALWNFPPLCCWRLLSVLLRTFFFEFFCFFFFFDRTLVSVDALGRLLGSKPELKRTHVETNVPRKLTVTARTIFSPPHKAQIVSEGESQGRHLDTGSGFTRKHDRRGPNGQLPCILERQRRLPRTLRDHVPSASALSALKKVWSPTCPLNSSFQSPNCPLKGFFTRQTGFFSRKWPDGGRFFEP